MTRGPCLTCPVYMVESANCVFQEVEKKKKNNTFLIFQTDSYGQEAKD